jgi:fatty-acyl-CoA synthase
VCGDAVPGVAVTIQDARGANLPDRLIGEICVRGPSVMLGYWQAPEATAEVIRDGWLRTGDLGYRTPAGIVVCGRAKDMIIIGGANLYPEDYEHIAAQADTAVTRCAAFAVPDEERMIVAVELAGDVDPNAVADAVMARLRGELGHAPDRVVVIGRNAIPRTSSGKVQRGRCRENYFTGRLPVLAETTR